MLKGQRLDLKLKLYLSRVMSNDESVACEEQGDKEDDEAAKTKRSDNIGDQTTRREAHQMESLDSEGGTLNKADNDEDTCLDKKHEGLRKSSRQKKLPEKLKKNDITVTNNKSKREKEASKVLDTEKINEIDTKNDVNRRWCVCQKTYKEDDSTMIDCSDCPNWFHIKCVAYKCTECHDKGQIEMKEEGELQYYKRKYEEEQIKVKETKWMLNDKILKLETEVNALKEGKERYDDGETKAKNLSKQLKSENHMLKKERNDAEERVIELEKESSKNKLKIVKLEQEKNNMKDKQNENIKKMKENIAQHEEQSKITMQRLRLAERDSSKQKKEIKEWTEKYEKLSSKHHKKIESADHGEEISTIFNPDENKSDGGEDKMKSKEVDLKKELAKAKSSSKKWEKEASELKSNLTQMVHDRQQLLNTIKHLTDNLDLLKNSCTVNTSSTDETKTVDSSPPSSPSNENKNRLLEKWKIGVFEGGYYCMEDDDIPNEDIYDIPERGDEESTVESREFAPVEENQLAESVPAVKEKEEIHNVKINDEEKEEGEEKEIQKQLPCKYHFNKNTRCWFGKKCRYSHEQEPELRRDDKQGEKSREKSHQGEKSICKHFMGRGCHFGDRCRFVHPERKKETQGGEGRPERRSKNYDDVSKQFTKMAVHEQMDFLERGMKKLKRLME